MGALVGTALLCRPFGVHGVTRPTGFFLVTRHMSLVTSRKPANDLCRCIGGADFVTRKNSAPLESRGLPGLTKRAAGRWRVQSSLPQWFSPKNSVIAA